MASKFCIVSLLKHGPIQNFVPFQNWWLIKYKFCTCIVDFKNWYRTYNSTKKNRKCTLELFVDFFAEILYRGVIWPKKSIGALSFRFNPLLPSWRHLKVRKMPFFGTFLTTQISEPRNISANLILLACRVTPKPHRRRDSLTPSF